MTDVFCYEIEKYPCYKLWIIITIIILVFTIVLSCNVDYEKVYLSSGVVSEKNTLKVYCNKNNLKDIINNKKIIINNREFAYKNPVINSVIYDNSFYYEVLLNVDLDKSVNIENNVIDFKIPLQKMTILKYIMHKIGG